MTHDTHIIVQLPFGNKVPSRSEVLNRFCKLYVEYKPLLPLLTACAEESERMMLELFEKGRESEVKIFLRRSDRGNHLQTGYFCPACNRDGIKPDFRYCHGCGRAIVWR